MLRYRRSWVAIDKINLILKSNVVMYMYKRKSLSVMTLSFTTEKKLGLESFLSFQLPKHLGA
jgi:hypothetical protein